MSVVKYNRNVWNVLKDSARLYSTFDVKQYVNNPVYPPIVDPSFRAERLRKLESWGKEIKELSTVEEKLMKVNMPRYYGWNSIMLNDEKVPYNALPFIQHCTRTHLITDVLSLPFKVDIMDDSIVDTVVTDIQPQIIEALEFEHNVKRALPEFKNMETESSAYENMMSTSIIQQINRILLNNLAQKCAHLTNIQMDLDPRHEAFWFVGGLPPFEAVRNMRKNNENQKDRIDEPIDRGVQFIGTPCLALRSHHPLQSIIPHSQSSNMAYVTPEFKYDARVLGYNSQFRHGTTIPGFWPGDSHQFGLLSYHKRGHILDRTKTFGNEDDIEALHVQGILSSFSWLFAQACYQGFSTYNDVTYPLVSQTIITNGKLWSFYVYQLNTTLFHSNHITDNPMRNVCWATAPLELYDGFDGVGKIVGFKTNVLKMILQMYMNRPLARDCPMQPYLGEHIKVIADIPDDERRTWLERQYKHMMSNRSRHRLGYEMYNWERIYKVDNKTRPMEARRRPFEINVNPMKRPYDEHQPRYVPKSLRPEGTKRKNQNKWEKTFYP